MAADGRRHPGGISVSIRPFAAPRFAYRVTLDIDGSWSRGPTFDDDQRQRVATRYPAVTVLAPLHVVDRVKPTGFRFVP